MSVSFAVIVSGGLGAGKTTAARHLRDAHGLEHLSFVKQIWLPILQKRSLEPTRENLQVLGIELIDTLGVNSLVERLLASGSSCQVVIDDARRSDVVQRIRDQVPRVVHLHLSADFETRYKRLVDRDQVQSRNAQRKAEKVVTETSIAAMGPIADYRISNVKDTSELFDQIDSIMQVQHSIRPFPDA